MPGQLTQKERMLLQDQLKHEELCIRKYTGYASISGNQDIRRMFNEIAKDEQNHYNTVNGFLAGTTPGQGGQVSQVGGAAQGMSVAPGGEAQILDDMLVTEKYISGSYDTAIFEASNPQLRQALKQIQDDEQNHGETIYNYMQQKGMYRPQ